ncbi:MAG TPA: RluA family pseudouridine synthase [Acidimicrobiia bacterium]|nr:RluA family pseudouridine synthase [Acidimicrobiia bacterium]
MIEPLAAPESFVVPETLDGERVDRALGLLLDWSRTEAATMCAAGAVFVDGDTVSKSRRLAAGETVDVTAEPGSPAPPGPDPSVAVTVRYEDDDVIVVAKPAGLVVHPGAGRSDGTLVNGLLARYPELASVGDPARPGIVHRLDRNTSGLLVVARTAAAYEQLVAGLSAREIERRYDALVWGVPDAERGIVDAPIGRSVARRTRMAVRAGGRPARTRYEVVERFSDPAVSLLACSLETGRTHQIRVHLAAIGHPVVGDATYGGTRPALALRRPFLHAAELALTHPRTGVPLHLSEPLPPELANLLAAQRG